jgi:hypothetical protein
VRVLPKARQAVCADEEQKTALVEVVAVIKLSFKRLVGEAWVMEVKGITVSLRSKHTIICVLILDGELLSHVCVVNSNI